MEETNWKQQNYYLHYIFSSVTVVHSTSYFPQNVSLWDDKIAVVLYWTHTLKTLFNSKKSSVNMLHYIILPYMEI